MVGGAAYLRDTLHGTGHGQHPFMNAGNDLADASLDARLFTELGDIFSCLANDDASVLGANEGA